MPTIKHHDWSVLQPPQRYAAPKRHSKRSQPKRKHKPRAKDKQIWAYNDQEVTSMLIDIGRL